MSARSQHWADLGESTSVRGILLLCAVHRWLGRWPFRACVYPVVLAHWLLNGTARRASLQYLRRAHAHLGVPARRPGMGQSLHHFAMFAETMLDKILALGQRYPVDEVRMERNGVLARVRSGQGGLIVTGHLGCLELCQVMAEQVPGMRLTALVHTAHAERFNRMMRQLDETTRVELLQVTDLGPADAVKLAERVARGEFVAIAGDRVPLRGGRSVSAPFLGHEARFPIGAYVLGAALRCPVFVMACLHEGDGYAVQFDTFAERIELPRGSRDAALAGYAAQFSAWMEQQVRRSPYDWFNFYPFWDQVTHDARNE